MHGSSKNVAVPIVPGLSQRHSALAVAILITLGAFAVGVVLGIGSGGDAADRTMLPVVRFLALVVGASGLAVAMAAGLHVARSRLRWSLGQASAAGVAVGGGLLWSGSAYGAAFGCIVIGGVCSGLLAAKELERRD